MTEAKGESTGAMWLQWVPLLSSPRWHETDTYAAIRQWMRKEGAKENVRVQEMLRGIDAGIIIRLNPLP